MANSLQPSSVFQNQAGPIPLLQLDVDIVNITAALNNFSTFGNYVVDQSGTPNVITVTTPVGTVFAYISGTPIQVQVANTTTATGVTINVNGLGAKAVLNGDLSLPATGQISVNQVLTLIYDGTRFLSTLVGSTVGGTVSSVGITSATLTVTGSPITSSGNIAVTLPSVVAPGSALSANITVDAFGRITAYSSGGTGTVTSVGLTSTNLTVTGSPITTAGALTVNLPVPLTLAAPGSAQAALNVNGIAGTHSTKIAGSDAVLRNAGYLEVPQNIQQVNYTAVLSDSGKSIWGSVASLTYTIPSNASVAYPLGTVLTFVNRTNTNYFIQINADTLILAGTGVSGNRTLAQNGIATAYKSEATAWVLSGTGVT